MGYGEGGDRQGETSRTFDQKQETRDKEQVIESFPNVLNA
jgi:hypothetical protein